MSNSNHGKLLSLMIQSKPAKFYPIMSDDKKASDQMSNNPCCSKDSCNITFINTGSCRRRRLCACADAAVFVCPCPHTCMCVRVYMHTCSSRGAVHASWA